MSDQTMPISPSLLNVIRNRRSVRKFDDRPVERHQIITCVEAARLAPSADNIQPWRFIVVDEPALLGRLHQTAFSGIYRVTRWAEKAPVIIAMTADIHMLAHKMGGGLQSIPFHFIDLGIAGEHFVLQAEAQGLGTCWIGWFHVKKTAKLLQIPKNNKLCGLMAVGYPEKGWKPKKKKLKSLNDICFVGKWGNPIK